MSSPEPYFVVAIAIDSAALEFLGPPVHHDVVVVPPEQRAVVVIDLPRSERAFTSSSRDLAFTMQKN